MALGLLAGCGTVQSMQNEQEKIQAALSAILPPDFSGDVHIDHFNPYFNFGIDAGNVHKNDKGLWTWDSFKWVRADMFHTGGNITLTPKK